MRSIIPVPWSRGTSSLVAVIVLVLAGSLAGACGSGGGDGSLALPSPVATPLQKSVPEAPGRLVWSHNNTIIAFEPATGQATRLVTLPAGQHNGPLALSPDSQSFALTTYQATPPEPGADLYVVPRDGGDAKELLGYQQVGGSIEAPSWSPDGAFIYATVTDPSGPTAYWLIRVPRAGGPPQKLLQGASYPVLSPDGKNLVFVKVRLQDQSSDLWQANPHGSTAKPIAGTHFARIQKPIFSPDGTAIGFTAIGDPMDSSASRSHLPLFGPSVASAHTLPVPWDAWTIPLTGGTPKRRSNVNEDQPSLAWSPDGQWLALNGEMGFYLIHLSDDRTYRFEATGGVGLIWLR